MIILTQECATYFGVWPVASIIEARDVTTTGRIYPVLGNAVQIMGSFKNRAFNIAFLDSEIEQYVCPD